jgi:hypothetical protein
MIPADLHAVRYNRSDIPHLDHPEAHGEPHPRAVEMADTMLDIAALGHGVTFKDLIGAGFTSAEVIEHHEEARRIAADRAVYRTSQEPDRLADMIEKARAPLPHKLPLPKGAGENQALVLAWGRYCAARGAYLLDTWSGQRERCIALLTDYLAKIPLFTKERKKIVLAVAETLARAAQ